MPGKALRATPYLYLAALAAVLLIVIYQQPASIAASASDGDTLGHFNALEQAQGRAYRWSSEQSNITLPRLSADERITLSLDGSRPADAPSAALQINVNGHYATTITPTNGIADYSFTYHDLALDPRLTVDLLPANPFYLSDKDYRQVGVIYYGIKTTSIASGLGLILPSPVVVLLWLLLAFTLGGLAATAQRRSSALLLYLFVLLFSLLLVGSGPTLAMAATSIAVLLLLPIAIFRQRVGLEAVLSQLLNWVAGKAIWRNRFARAAVMPLFYLVATVALTWPYVLDFASSVPGWPMDNFNFLYKIWWVAHATFGNPPPGASLTFNPNVFYPSGYNLAQGELSPANTLLSIPVTATLGPVVSYNLLVLLSFVLSGWGMFLLVRYLLTTFTAEGRDGNDLSTATGEREIQPQHPARSNQHAALIALLCGLAFAFCPYRMEQMGGHLQMLGTQWLPFTFLFVEKMLRERRWQQGALAGLFFALCCWEAWYYAAIIGLFVAIYIPIRWWQLHRTLAKAHVTAHLSAEAQAGLIASRPSLTARAPHFMIAFIVVAALMVLPFAIPYLQLSSSDNLTYSAAQANENSALPTDYFIPSFLHPLWGEVFAPLHRGHNPLEQDLYLGIVPLGLLCAAIALRRARRRLFSAFPFTLYLLMAGLAFIFSFGTGINEAKLLDNWGYTGINPDIDLWAPGWLVYKFVPLFSSLRAYARFGLVVIFAVIVLAALGLALLLAHARFARYRYLTVAILAVILLADFAANPYLFGMTRVANEPENVWLAALPPNTPIALFPADYALHDGQATWFTVYHQKPIVYGYESFLPALFRQPDVQTALYNFPNDKHVWPLLQSWGVKYVMVSTLWWGPNWPLARNQLAQNEHLRYITRFDEQRLWDGNVRLWNYWPDFEWHYHPDSIFVYALIYPPATPHSQ